MEENLHESFFKKNKVCRRDEKKKLNGEKNIEKRPNSNLNLLGGIKDNIHEKTTH
jgi:hypothetical protein